MQRASETILINRVAASSIRGVILMSAKVCLIVLLVCMSSMIGSVSSADNLFERWQLKPEYKSSYVNDRLTEKWDQKLAFTQVTDISNLATSLSSKNIESTRQNEDRSDFLFVLERSSPLGNFKLDSQLQRRMIYKEGYLRIENEDNIGLGGILNYGQPMKNRLKFDLLALYVGGEQAEERTRTTTFTSDRTNSSGWGGRALVDGEWKVSTATSLSTRLEYESSVEDSRTISIEASDSSNEREVQKNTDKNRTGKVTLKGGWEEFKAFMVNITGTYANTFSQYFYPQADGQETKEMLRASAGAFVGGQFGENLGYEISWSAAQNRNDYKLKTASNQETVDTGTNAQAFYITSLPLIDGTRFDVGMNMSNKRSDSRNTNQDRKYQKISGTAAKNITDQLSITFSGSETLSQDMNDDVLNDKDTYTITYSVTSRLKVPDCITATGYYKVDSKELIYVSDDKAVNSYQKNDYIIRADYTWLLPNKLQIVQKFSINSIYDFYSFNENKNSLNRRNKVTTRLSMPIMPRTTLMVEHRFEKSDNGSYIRSEVDGTRRYRVSSKTLIQGITSSISHSVNRFIKFSLNEQYFITRKTVSANDFKDRRDVIWISGRVDISRTLTEDILLNCSIEKKEGSKDLYTYWSVKADITKRF